MRFERSHARRAVTRCRRRQPCAARHRVWRWTTEAAVAGAAAAAALEGRGPITFATGKDTSGNLQQPGQGLELAAPEREGGAQGAPRGRQRAAAADDPERAGPVRRVHRAVDWTSSGRRSSRRTSGSPRSPRTRSPTSGKLIPATVETAKYRDKLYAVPVTSDGGLLYYRKDLLTKAGIAEAAEDVGRDARRLPQGRPRCPRARAIELLRGPVREVRRPDGELLRGDQLVRAAWSSARTASRTSTPRRPWPVCEDLVNGFKSGEIPKAAITYKEEEGRRAFQEGKLVFHRNWPYVYALANKTDGSSKVAGKFAVAPLPGKDRSGRLARWVATTTRSTRSPRTRRPRSTSSTSWRAKSARRRTSRRRRRRRPGPRCTTTPR